MNFKLLLLLPILEIISLYYLETFRFFSSYTSYFSNYDIRILLLKQNRGLNEIEKFSSDPKDWICKKVAAILLLFPGL